MGTSASDVAPDTGTQCSHQGFVWQEERSLTGTAKLTTERHHQWSPLLYHGNHDNHWLDNG